MAKNEKREFAPLITVEQLEPARAVVQQGFNAYERDTRIWKKGAKAVYDCGLRYSMIGGKDSSADTRTLLRDWIISMLPEKKRAVLTVKGHAVTEMSDEDRAMREVYQKHVGSYMALMTYHLKSLEGITAPRNPKKDAGTVADNMPDAGTYNGAIQRIEQVMQNAAKLPAIDAVSLAFVQNHCEELLVSLRAAKAKADKLAK
jgi:hypothetical protein